MIVPVGALAALILIIGAGFYLNPGNGPPDNECDEPAENESEYIEDSESEAFMPEMKVSAGDLTKNTRPQFEIGKKYNYKTTSSYEMEIMECAGDGGNRRSGTNMRIGLSSNDSNKSLPAGCVSRKETQTNNQEMEITVEGIERIENRDCYAVSIKEKRDIEEQIENMKKFTSDMTEEEIENFRQMMEQEMEQSRTINYYDKETGKCLQIKNVNSYQNMTVKGEKAEFQSLMSSQYSGSMFSEWMLALNDDFAWEQNFEMSSGGMYSMSGSINYRVVAQEKVNNRDCFKVEIEGTTKSEMKGDMAEEMAEMGEETTREDTINTVMWIDVNERILIKQQTKTGNLMTAETNLIS